MMKIKELIEELSKYPDETEVLIKKTDWMTNASFIANVKQDSYGFFGLDIPCVLITDEYDE